MCIGNFTTRSTLCCRMRSLLITQSWVLHNSSCLVELSHLYTYIIPVDIGVILIIFIYIAFVFFFCWGLFIEFRLDYWKFRWFFVQQLLLWNLPFKVTGLRPLFLNNFINRLRFLHIYLTMNIFKALHPFKSTKFLLSSRFSSLLEFNLMRSKFLYDSCLRPLPFFNSIYFFLSKLINLICILKRCMSFV